MQRPSPQLVKVGILLGTLGLVLAFIGCNHGSESGNWSAYGEGGEASGPELALGDSLIIGRAGAQLVLSYDSAANAFKGTVENTTTATLRSVRVEVQLSNGIEIGPDHAGRFGSRSGCSHHSPGKQSTLHLMDRTPRSRLIPAVPTPARDCRFVKTLAGQGPGQTASESVTRHDRLDVLNSRTRRRLKVAGCEPAKHPLRSSLSCS